MQQRETQFEEVILLFKVKQGCFEGVRRVLKLRVAERSGSCHEVLLCLTVCGLLKKPSARTKCGEAAFQFCGAYI